MTALLRWRLFLADPDRDPRAHRAVARRPAMTRHRWSLALANADRDPRAHRAVARRPARIRLRWRLALADADRRALTAASSLGAPP